NPQGDIEIKIVGLRPGEKMYEELLIGEDSEPTMHPKIRRARESHYEWQSLESALLELGSAVNNFDAAAITAVLETYVHGFRQSSLATLSTGKTIRTIAGAEPEIAVRNTPRRAR